MKKNIVKIVLIASILLINISNCLAAENEFGKVSAWYNDEPATVEGITLKINEPFTVKAIVESKITGNVYVEIYEPGITNAYKVIEGPSKIDEVIKNTKIESGWKTTYIWKLKPNGDWTNGNAPINLFVQFNQDYDDIRKVDFTIANPYILDEHYSGSTRTATPSSSGQPSSEGSPGFGILAALAVTALMVIWQRRRI